MSNTEDQHNLSRLPQSSWDISGRTPRSQTWMRVRSVLGNLWKCASSLVVLQFARELRVCVRVGCPRKPSVEGGVQHLVQVFGGNEVEVVSDVCWKLLQVLLVALGEDDALHSCSVGCQDLVLDAAHLQRTDPPGWLKLHGYGVACCVHWMW